MRNTKKAAVSRLLRFNDDTPTPFHAAAKLAEALAQLQALERLRKTLKH